MAYPIAITGTAGLTGLPLSPAMLSVPVATPTLVTDSVIGLPFNERSSSLLFIDTTVANYSDLMAGVVAGTEIHLLNSTEDAVSQITNSLMGRSGITDLHIVSHGQAGSLQFGSTPLVLANLPTYANQLQTWRNALTADADILLYGCDIAAGERGQAFVSLLSQLTGADIAASNNMTGSIEGSDWQLEIHTGEIAASLVFQAETLANYHSRLSVELISAVSPNLFDDSTTGSISSSAISADGRYVVFTSSANNLVPDDTNHTSDIFLRDQQTGVTTLVSRSSNGNGGNGESSNPVISDDGNFIAFTSFADDLVSNDGNSRADVFVWNRLTGMTTLVSHNSTGNSGGDLYSNNPVISGDGNFIVFTSIATNLVSNDNNNDIDVYVWNRQTGINTLVSHKIGSTDSGNAASYNPVISRDGSFIAFESMANNLVSNDNNNHVDVFVWNRQTEAISLISHNLTNNSSGNGDSSEPTISSDGGFITFQSLASDLSNNDSDDTWDVFIWNQQTGINTLVSRSTSGGSSGSRFSFDPVISSNGSVIVFTSPADNLASNDSSNGGFQDVFVWDRQTGVTTLVSRTSNGNGGNGESSNPVISDDGNFIAFTSFANDLVSNDNNFWMDVFIWNRLTGVTTLVSHNSMGDSGNYYSNHPVISGDGNFIAFDSSASDLTGLRDTNVAIDVFLYDRITSSTTLVSRHDPNLPSRSGNADSSISSINSVSDDGRFVVFASNVTNLVENDTNHTFDVFLRDRQTGTTTLVSHTSTGNNSANGPSHNPVISSDGNVVTFTSAASDLVSNDNNSAADVFVWNRQTGAITLVSHNSMGTGSGNSGSAASHISSDGNVVTFTSTASNLVSNDNNYTNDVFVWNQLTGIITLVSRNNNGTGSGNNASFQPIISSNGDVVVFSSNASDLVSNDSNNTIDLFAWNRLTNVTTLLGSIVGSGSPFNPTVSSDGNFVAFVTNASDLVSNHNSSGSDVFIWNQQTGEFRLVSHNSSGTDSGYGPSYNPVISSDGNFIAFESSADDLTSSDNNLHSDIFIWSRQTGQITLVSHDSSGSRGGNGESFNSLISHDGNVVVFNSFASDLVNGDSNNTNDIFSWNRQTGTITRLSPTSSQDYGYIQFSNVTFSNNGTFIVFESDVNDPAVGDYNFYQDVFGLSLNTAPLLTATNVTLSPIAEDAPAPAGPVGSPVSSLVDLDAAPGGLDNVTDNDAGAMTGVAITAIDTSNGSWFYSINNGNTWMPIASVTASSALLLAANANNRLYFQPQANFTGTATLTLRAWDQTFGINGSTADATIAGGINAFSTAITTASITVTPIDDTEFWVTNTNDSGNGSLRQAIALANADGGAETIRFTGAVFTDTTPDTITLAAGELTITADVTLNGTGATQLTLIGNGSATGRVFHVTNGAIVNLNSLTIANSSSATNGGGLFNDTGTVTLTNVRFTGNQAESGGAIYNDANSTITLINSTLDRNTSAIAGGSITNRGNLTLINSTISGNTSGGAGGGIFNNGGTVTLNFVTVAQNTANLGTPNSGGGIANGAGSVTLRNTLIANNSGTTSGDVAGTFTSLGNNLISRRDGSTGFGAGDVVGTNTAPINTRLGTLHNNGGPTPTHRLLAGSPAINGGNNTNAPLTDQRGVQRSLNGRADIGAFEFSPQPDFNLDGDIDLIWRNSLSGTNVLWQMTGSRLSTVYFLPAITASEWQIVGHADFDGDGDTDLMWRHVTTGQTTLWEMHGFTYSTFYLLPSPAATWSVAGIRDFNGDGQPDIVWRNATTGQTTIWQMHGFTYSTFYLLPTVDSDWRIERLADFNRDGSPEIIWRNLRSGLTTIWQMNGFTYSQFHILGTIDLSWAIAGVDDFNGDGNPELVWRNATSDITTIWQMNGFSYSTFHRLPQTGSSAWRIERVADYNNDGSADVLWFNTVTGQSTIWQMNGFSFSTFNLLPTQSTDWRILIDA